MPKERKKETNLLPENAERKKEKDRMKERNEKKERKKETNLSPENAERKKEKKEIKRKEERKKLIYYWRTRKERKKKIE